MVLRLAVRNLWRNTRRTALTVSGIAIAMALMFTSMSIENGTWNAVISAAIQSSAGHVVVQAPGWQVDRDAELVVARGTEVQHALARVWPDATVVRRTFLGGLLTSPTGSSSVSLEGVEPALEAGISLVDDRVVDGAWLSDDDRAIVLGDRLASTLGVGLGDKVVFMTQVSGEDMQSRLYRVGGLLHTGVEMLDSFAAFATVASTQELLPGDDPVHQVAVVWPAIGRSRVDIAPAVQAMDGRTDVEVLPWNRALPMLEEQARLDGQFSKLMYGFMGLIVAVGLLNTVLMSVMERMKEFGVMLSVGMPPGKLTTMILFEGAILGVMGGVGGVLLSLGPMWWLHTRGLDYGELMADANPAGAIAMDPVLRAQPDPSQMAVLVGIGVVMAVLAAAWPARKARLLQPIEALRHH
ncbi:MAG: ABC transporter permease [Alphaproteobacteria bacterium]|nr:ABC transporter permease [Alphaproteobacteria bacterium]